MIYTCVWVTCRRPYHSSMFIVPIYLFRLFFIRLLWLWELIQADPFVYVLQCPTGKVDDNIIIRAKTDLPNIQILFVTIL